MLALYEPKRNTQVHTDACKYGVAGILSQEGGDGALKTVSSYSRKTASEEQKPQSFEFETLAVMSLLSKI